MNEKLYTALDKLNKLDFFYGQRAGRELWFSKPVDVQDADIKSFVNDIKFIKDFINEQNDTIKHLKDFIEDDNPIIPYKPKGKWIVKSIEMYDLEKGIYYRTVYMCPFCKSSIVGLENMN